MDAPSVTGTLTSLHWVDQVGLGVALVFMGLGARRGLWWQVVRFAGLSVAVAVARWVGPVWGEEIHSRGDLPVDFAQGIGWAGAFLLTLGGIAVFGMMGSRTIEAMKLGLINRLLGAVAGLATGTLMFCAGVWGCSRFSSTGWRADVLSDTWTSRAIEEMTVLVRMFPT